MLANIRSAYNVGAILRTAEGLGVRKIIFAGYTPMPETESPESRTLPHVAAKLSRQIKKTALGAEQFLDKQYIEDLPNYLEMQKNQGYKIIGLENNLTDNRLKRLNEPELKNSLGNKIVLVLGEEVYGIEQTLYPLMDYFLEIPMRGHKESFNVSVATGIALYQLLVD